MAFKTHVAKIPTKNSLILAAGIKDGIDVGDEFDIIQPGIEIIDESTNKTLGNFNRQKSRVEVVSVFERFCIVKHIVRKSLLRPTLPINAFSMNTFMSSQAVELPVDEKEINYIAVEGFDEIIHIGDVAIKIFD
ncbi:hypothetical protein [Fructobacillus ficulneus]|uniref:Uncharacterized protein n=1 Tax=Fructobacillus ficulneus TaxID=157463 RepID=A0A0K8MI90_9LACO|nr:hypothetical protein [Fructobacillus ficulneus]GAO99903.1 hypothetical protein FFIC_260170 [Fructobacillus ficulneus]